MNIEKANSIPMSEILKKLNIQIDDKKSKPNDLWYYSPFRDEATASFHINVSKNVWFDFGQGIGGDFVSFVCAWLKATREDYTVVDALRWIRKMSDETKGDLPTSFHTEQAQQEPEKPVFTLKTVKTINNIWLKQYLKKRGISLELAQKYLKELCVYNAKSNKDYVMLGFKNDEGGFELRNPFFQSCLRPKYVTAIRGSEENSKVVHVFEGFMDFLSLLEHYKIKRLRGDAIVLNSLSCLNLGISYLEDSKYETLHSWMDNDKAGTKAVQKLDEFIKTEPALIHKKMNSRYQKHKDVNAWHMHNLNL